MNPVISIIVPVHNIDAYLSRCLESILAQTFTNFEVILVNDGSTDKSGIICNAYALLDKRVKVIHQNYGGVSAARNAGVAAATGEYIGFVDGDDYIKEDMFEVLHQLCADTGSDISICKLGREINGKLVNNDPEQLCIKELSNVEALRELFKGVLYRFSLCNKLFKKSCFNNVTFPVGRIHEDLATTYKLFDQANKAVFTNYTGYIYVKRKDSILTASYYEKRLDAFLGWDEIIPFMHKHYPQLSNEVSSCYTYNCIDHFYYILNQVKDRESRKRYLERIQWSVRNHYKRIQKCPTLSFYYKFMIAAINYNVRLLLVTNRVKVMLKNIPTVGKVKGLTQ